LIPARFKTLREFGKAIGWGKGDAAALRRAGNISRDELELIDVTIEIAQSWVDVYDDEYDFNDKNPSANGRLVLMRRCMELLRN
jgi:hypothetical protein